MRIPLPIFAGDIDHMLPRPGQIGDDVFESIDLDVWRATGERRPASHSTERKPASRLV